MNHFASKKPGLVAVIIYNALCTFEFGLAVEVFGLARPEFDFPWYDFAVVTGETREVTATGGVSICAGFGLEKLAEAHTIVVPGWRDRDERPLQPLLDALTAANARGARLMSICSGVFVLAAAGLLKGKRATTHWRYLPTLKAQYPDIIIEDDVLYVDEGDIITSAGSAAGIDAALHLVRCDFGTAVANTVARRLVMSPHRDGGQAQFSAAPVAEQPGPTLAQVVEWARANIASPIGLADMAERAHMSTRTFIRRFHDAFGMPPMAWLKRERMYQARELLETTDAALGEVAARCGYPSPDTFRITFKRTVGTSPAAYRARFSRTEPTIT